MLINAGCLYNLSNKLHGYTVEKNEAKYKLI